MPGETVLLGLGANLGRPMDQLAEAVRRLERVVRVQALSSIYRSDPVGHLAQPEFYNGVVVCHTPLDPLGLLRAAQAVEQEMGRVRTFANAPRTIDIDLLAYGARVLDAHGLVLPHPGIPSRGFVLHPLAEVAPEWRHPVLGRTAGELLSGAGPGRVRRVGPFPTPPWDASR